MRFFNKGTFRLIRMFWLASVMSLVCFQTAFASSAQHTALNEKDITVSGYVREMAPMQKMGAAYLAIHNTTSTALILDKVSLTGKGHAHLHGIKEEQGLSKMIGLKGIRIEPGQRYQMQPMAEHVMLMGLPKRLVAGDHLELVAHLIVEGAVDEGAVDKGAAKAGSGAILADPQIIEKRISLPVQALSEIN